MGRRRLASAQSWSASPLRSSPSLRRRPRSPSPGRWRGDPALSYAGTRATRSAVHGELRERPAPSRTAPTVRCGPRWPGSGKARVTPVVPEIPGARCRAAAAEGRSLSRRSPQPPVHVRGGTGDRRVQASRQPLHPAGPPGRSSVRATTPATRTTRHREVARLRPQGRAQLRPQRARDRLPASRTRSTSRSSSNTRTAFVPDAVSALVRGVIAAKRESRRRGYEHQEIGFNYAFRFGDANDAGFWDAVAAKAAGLRRATDWAWGSTSTPGPSCPGRAEIVNLGDAPYSRALPRRGSAMRKAGFTRSTPLRIEEIGYPTGPGRSEPEQSEPFAGSWGPPWPTAAPTASPTFAGSASGTTTERPELPVLLRTAARRLLGQAGIRRLPPTDRPARRPRGAAAGAQRLPRPAGLRR